MKIFEKIGLIYDNNKGKSAIIVLRRDILMNKVIDFFQKVLMIKEKDNMKVGLTQFRVEEKEELQPKAKDVSIRTKDVKLSDLMRRVG